jgi:hypothetical protein
MKYKLFSDLHTGQPCGVYGFDDNGKASAIPFDEGNTDYQAYLKWLAEGNQPLPADEGTPSA